MEQRAKRLCGRRGLSSARQVRAASRLDGSSDERANDRAQKAFLIGFVIVGVGGVAIGVLITAAAFGMF